MVYNMNEKQGESFTKVVLKKAGRAKERLMQNFGKLDRTTDELFELYENNFNKQQNSAIRLQKEVKNYVTCIRSMQAASKNLMDCLSDIYEPEFPGHEQIPFKAQNLETLWEELCSKLNDQVTIPLSTYLSQFSEIKAKIDKRGRKLIDYDSSRHALEAVQNNHKKKDEIKLAKLRDEMEGARRLYDVLNKELHEELPALYDSRIPFLISVLQTLFATQSAFFGQNARIQTQLNNYVDELALEAKKGTYHINARLLANNFNQHIDPLTGQMLDSDTGYNLQSTNLTRSQQQLSNETTGNYNLNNNNGILETTAAAFKFAAQTNLQTPTGPHKIVVNDANSPIPSAANLNNQVSGHEIHPPPGTIKVKSNSEEDLKNENVNQNSLNNQSINTNQNEQTNKLNHKQTNGHNDKINTNHNETNGLSNSPTQTNSSPIVHHIKIEKESNSTTNENNKTNNTNNLNNKEQTTTTTKNLYEIPSGANTANLPPGVFYKVKATYKYDAEDEDELSFEAGDIIYVIEYEYEEEQEDGWLMGCKSSDGKRGLFPQNFTQPI